MSIESTPSILISLFSMSEFATFFGNSDDRNRKAKVKCLKHAKNSEFCLYFYGFFKI